jgi:leucyl aminopeptidase (aminopeptidase T)
VDTDRGAARLGELALVPRRRGVLVDAPDGFGHALLDENALPHVALGEAYPFAAGRPGTASLNHSLVHVDLPMDAEVRLIDAERR